jgi:hypothetical protein
MSGLEAALADGFSRWIAGGFETRPHKLQLQEIRRDPPKRKAAGKRRRHVKHRTSRAAALKTAVLRLNLGASQAKRFSIGNPADSASEVSANLN